MKSIEEYKEMCAEKDWDKLRSFLTSNIMDVSLKILVTALFDVYHFKDEPEHRGLSLWTKDLNGSLVTPMQNLFTGSVDLIDFAKAINLADGENGLNEPKVAQVLKDYVNAHQFQFSPCLDNEYLSGKTRKMLNTMFPNLAMTKQQREQRLQKDIAQYTKSKISFFQARDQMMSLFESLFDIKGYEYETYVKEPKNLLKFQQGNSETIIHFKDLISEHYVQAICDILEKISITLFQYFNCKRPEGRIEVGGMPEDIAASLNEFKAFLEADNASDTESNFAQARELLKTLSELKYLPSQRKEYTRTF